MQALYFTPDGATADNATNPLPQLPIITGYPQTSAIAVLPLEAPLYRTQVSFQFLNPCRPPPVPFPAPIPHPPLNITPPPLPPPTLCPAPLASRDVHTTSLGQKCDMADRYYSPDLI